MRIGKFEIRLSPASRKATQDRVLPSVDRTATFAVSVQEAWWLAVHQLLNELEAETIAGARNQMANTNLCIGAVGASEGVAMVRQRLIETRDQALHLKGNKEKEAA